jgi:hypothetical protein
VGITNVVYTGADPSGNQGQCTFDVEITSMNLGCGSPINVSANNISNFSMKINWDVTNNADNYTLRFKPSGSTAPFVWLAAVNNYRWLFDLEKGTEYEVQVRSNCPLENSPWSPSEFFTTTDTCAVPENFSLAFSSATYVKLDWDDAPGAQAYTVKFREEGSPASFVWKAANNSKKWLINLTSAMDYEYQVRSYCVTENSAWVPLEFFSTDSCDMPSSFSITEITATTARVVWTPMPGALKYRIQYRESGVSTWTQITTTLSGAKYLTGLEPGMTYEVRMKTKCSYGWGAYTTIQNFTTQLVKIASSEIPERILELEVYPNPAVGYIQVKLPVIEASDLRQIIVSDAAGRVLIRKSLDSIERNPKFDVHGLTQGMYIVRLETQRGESWSSKFIKQ